MDLPWVDIGGKKELTKQLQLNTFGHPWLETLKVTSKCVKSVISKITEITAKTKYHYSHGDLQHPETKEFILT